MKHLLAILSFLTTLSAGEPTLSSGHAISLHVRKMTNWAGTDSSTALVKNISDNYEDRYDIFNMNSETADFQVVKVWPSNTTATIHVSFAWTFTCDLISSNNLARQIKIAGPCGAGWQIDTVSSVLKLGPQQTWMPLRTYNLSDSVADRKNTMSTSSAWINITLEGADSAEVLIANWVTDKVTLASPKSLTLPDFVSLRNDRGSDLKVVSTEIPVPIRYQEVPKPTTETSDSRWNSSTSSWQFRWENTTVDLKGRK